MTARCSAPRQRASDPCWGGKGAYPASTAGFDRRAALFYFDRPSLRTRFRCDATWFAQASMSLIDRGGSRCGAMTAPKAAPVRSFTGTVTMPTREKVENARCFLRSEARKADREADTREAAWKRGMDRLYPDTEPNYAWKRGYAAGIRVALVTLDPDALRQLAGDADDVNDSHHEYPWRDGGGT